MVVELFIKIDYGWVSRTVDEQKLKVFLHVHYTVERIVIVSRDTFKAKVFIQTDGSLKFI